MSRGEQKLITVAILNRKSWRLQRSLQGVGQPKQRKHGCRKAQYLAVAERLGNDRIVNLPPDLAREFGGLSRAVRPARRMDSSRSSATSRSKSSTPPPITAFDPSRSTRAPMRSQEWSDRVADFSLIRIGSPPRMRSRARNDSPKMMSLTS